MTRTKILGTDPDDTRNKIIASIKNFETRDITTNFLEELFEAIDKYYFGGELEERLKERESILEFKVSQGTRVAGVCKMDNKRCNYTISISKKLFDGLFKNGEKSLLNNGLKCYSKNKCVLTTMEHEIGHLIMFLYDLYDDHHGRVFQCVVKDLFGHTDFRHELTLGDPDERLKREDVRVGMKVKTNRGVGTVTKLNPKTAKVDIDGKLWNMPYPLLHPVVKKMSIEDEQLEKLLEMIGDEEDTPVRSPPKKTPRKTVTKPRKTTQKKFIDALVETIEDEEDTPPRKKTTKKSPRKTVTKPRKTKVVEEEDDYEPKPFVWQGPSKEDDPLYEKRQTMMKKYPLDSLVMTPLGEGTLEGYQALGKVQAVVRLKSRKAMEGESHVYFPFNKIKLVK